MGAPMWNIDTPWFDLAVVMSIFAFGNATFGRFEEHKHRALRVLKIAVVSAVFLGVAATAGRVWAYALLSVPLLAALYVHAGCLTNQCITGWTTETRDKYL